MDGEAVATFQITVSWMLATSFFAGLFYGGGRLALDEWRAWRKRQEREWRKKRKGKD